MSVAAPVQTKHCIAYLRLSATMAALTRPYTNVMSPELIFTSRPRDRNGEPRERDQPGRHSGVENLNWEVRRLGDRDCVERRIAHPSPATVRHKLEVGSG
jgi:hypothetical protein